MNTIADQVERLEALDSSRSFIVSAPAGSGKTGLITQRILALLAQVQNPEEILAITFTRKAAGEMASRVQQALITAATEDRPQDIYSAQTWDLANAALARDKALNWDILASPGRLRIQTIDSFCRYIARQFSLETKMGELAEPTEHPELAYQEASRLLLERLESDEQLRAHLTILLAHTGNDLARCQRLLSELLFKREQWLPLIFESRGNRDYFNQVITQIVDENLLLLQQILLPVAGELVELVNTAAENIDEQKNPQLARLRGLIELPQTGLDDIPTWNVILSLLITGQGDIRKKVDKTIGFPRHLDEAKQRMHQLLDWCRSQPTLMAHAVIIGSLPDREISNDQQQVLDALSYILPNLAAQLDIYFKSNDMCDYPAVTLAALEATTGPNDSSFISDVTLRLDYQLSHILVDEFQDTSGSQLQLLTNLVSEWHPAEGKTLFLVGDGMQSLYGFRNANVGLFINSQRHPIGAMQCQPLFLSTNFRSDQGIVEWVNDVFSRGFPSQPDIVNGAIPYSPSTAFKPPAPDKAVNFHGFTGILAEHAEAEHIAEKCLKIATDSNASIAILVRSRRHLKHIIPALHKAGLQWEAHAITPLAARMPVMDMLSLTKALISPADRVAWLSVLRSPYCGLGLEDLLIITNSTQLNPRRGDPVFQQLMAIVDTSVFDQLSEHGQATLLRVVPILQRAWQHRGHQPMRNVVETCWDDLGGNFTLTSTQDAIDLQTYLDLVEKWDDIGLVRNWPSVERAVESLYAHPITNRESSQLTNSCIKIMTIHKSKGLEFDHVFLPGLSSPSASDSKPLLRWQKRVDQYNRSSLVMAPLGAHDREDDSVYIYLRHQETVRSRLEDTRVLYVAATRAIKYLHLSSKLTELKDGKFRTPGKSTLLHSIWPSIEASLEQGMGCVIATEQSVAPSETQQNPNPPMLRRLPKDFSREIKKPSMPVEINSDVVQQPHYTEELSPRLRHLGTVLHRTLKQIVKDGISHWSEDKLQAHELVWRTQLKEMGVLVSDNEISDLRTAINQMLKDEKGRWILSNHNQSRCELSLSYFRRDQDIRGISILDRTFVDDGIRWVIDYKYSWPREAERLTDFLHRQSLEYAAQMAHYSRLAASLGDQPVRCALYFPMIAEFTPISVD